MSILPAISKPAANVYLREIAFVAEDANEFSVNNKHHVNDGNENTYADAAFWGAGQGLTITLPEPKRIGAVSMVSDVYEGPDWSACALHFAGQMIQTLLGEGKKRVSWTGDVTTDSFSVQEYARTRIYEIKIWEIVEFEPRQQAVIEPPSPVEIATPQAVAKVQSGVAEYVTVQNELVQTQDIDVVKAYVNQQAGYWANLAELDADNVNTQGTFGYFAASAADFWAEAQNTFGRPEELLRQAAFWRDYSAAQEGKDFADMQPIDIWFEAL